MKRVGLVTIVLVGLCLVVPGASLAVTGITHTYTSGFHLFVVDLQANLRCEVAFANDVWDGSAGERVSSMAARHGAVLAVNTDYFAPNYSHGAQGMTYRNGVKYRCDQWHSSLAISSENDPDISLGFVPECGGTRTDPKYLYNVLGGGPQFVANGLPYWDRVGDSINGEGFPGTSGWDAGNSLMTAIGYSSDRRYLYIAVSTGGKTPIETARFLAQHGAWTAMKFDGGGSSQVYFDGQTLIDGRRVAEALLIYDNSGGSPSTSWLFDHLGDTEGWTTANVDGAAVTDGVLAINPGATDPQLRSPELNATPSSLNYLRMGIKNTGGNTVGQIYFDGTGLGYSEERSRRLDIPSNGRLNWITGRLDAIHGWSTPSSISHVRIDPVQAGVPVNGSDDVLIDYIFLRKDSTNPNPPSGFSVSPGEWSNTNAFTVTWQGTDPSDRPINPIGPDVYGSGVEYFWYRVENDPVSRIDQNAFDDRTGIATASVVVAANHQGANVFHVYSVDATDHVGAEGTVELRYDAGSPTQPVNTRVTPVSNAANSFAFSWSASSDEYSGVAGYLWKVNEGAERFTTRTSLPAEAHAARTGQNTFYVRARDRAGNCSPYSEVVFDYLPSPPPTCGPGPDNLLGNGSFNGPNCWSVFDPDRRAEVDFVGQLHAVIEPSIYTAVMATQSIPIETGTTYSVSFNVRGSQPSIITCGVQNRDAPWQPYGLWQDVVTDSDGQRVWEVFTATASDPEARFFVALGLVSGDIWIDDVVVRRVDCRREPGQLVGDPTFETLDCWRWQHRSPDRLRVETDERGNRAACITSSAPDMFWKTQIYQPGLQLESSRRYVLSQTIETDRPMDVFVSIANSRNEVIGAWDSLRVNGGPFPIESTTFSPSGTLSTEGAKLVYAIGKSSGTCKIGDVRLTELHCELDANGMVGDGMFDGRDCWIFQHRTRDLFTVEHDSEGQPAGHIVSSAPSESIWVTQAYQKDLRLHTDKRYYLHAEIKSVTPGAVANLQLTNRANWKALFYRDYPLGDDRYTVIDTLLSPAEEVQDGLLGFGVGMVGGDYWIRNVRLEERENCFREPGNLVASPDFLKQACWDIPAGGDITNGVARITVGQAQGDPWAVALGQGGIVLTNRWRYRLTFEARCTRVDTPIRLYVGTEHQGFGGNILLEDGVALGPDWQSYSLEGLAATSTDNGYVALGFGAQAAEYSIRSVRLAIVPDPLSYRDKYKQPFASSSIWNTPIGSGARYVPAGLGPAGAAGIDDDYFIVTQESDPRLMLFNNESGWLTGRCQGDDSTGIWTNVPYDLVVPDVRQDWTPNNSAAILQPDGESLVQLNALARCEPGGPIFGVPVWRDRVPLSNESVYGDGIVGGHGGSLLSSIGGSVRRSELISSEPIRHALKVDIWCERYAFPDSGGYRWPAQKSDGCWDPSCTASRYGGTNRAVRMGALLAIPPEFSDRRVTLQTEVGRKLFDALRDYGAYVADNSAWDCLYLCAERGVREETETYSGHSIDTMQDTPYHQDVNRLLQWLHVVDNNRPESIGGPGSRIAYQVIELQRDDQDDSLWTDAEVPRLRIADQGRSLVNFTVETAEPCHGDLRIYDVGGRLVAEVFQGQFDKGSTNLAWALTAGERRISSGIYFARLRTGRGSATLRVPVVR